MSSVSGFLLSETYPKNPVKSWLKQIHEKWPIRVQSFAIFGSSTLQILDVVISTIQKSSQKTVSLKKFYSVHHKQIISNSNDLSRQINCRISILINSEIC